MCSFLAFLAFFFFGFKKKILKVIDDDKLFFINNSHSSFDFFVCWIARETENNILKKTAHTIKREREREQVKIYAIRDVRQAKVKKDMALGNSTRYYGSSLLITRERRCSR